MVKAVDLSGREYEYRSELLGEGGMKRVHLTTDGLNVVCFFKGPFDPIRKRRLVAIVDQYRPNSDLFCWPTAVLKSPELGIVYPVYPESFKFRSGRWVGRIKEAKWYTSLKLRPMLPPEERGDLMGVLRSCRQLCLAVVKMHMSGLSHADLSAKNVLVDPPSGRAMVVDVDSLVVPNVYQPFVMGSPGYIAPEVLSGGATPNLGTDLHALAVLLYELLTGRHPLVGKQVHSEDPETDERLTMGERALYIEHPTDHRNRPDGLSALGIPHLADLFRRAFVDGIRGGRPSAGEWLTALDRAVDSAVLSGGTWSFQGTTARVTVGRRALPLYSGLVVLNRHLVRAGGTVDPVAEVRLQGLQWVLINLAGQLLSSKGNQVPVGAGCLLVPGVRLNGVEIGLS